MGHALPCQFNFTPTTPAPLSRSAPKSNPRHCFLLESVEPEHQPIVACFVVKEPDWPSVSVMSCSRSPQVAEVISRLSGRIDCLDPLAAAYIPVRDCHGCRAKRWPARNVRPAGTYRSAFPRLFVSGLYSGLHLNAILVGSPTGSSAAIADSIPPEKLNMRCTNTEPSMPSELARLTRATPRPTSMITALSSCRLIARWTRVHFLSWKRI